MLAHEKGKTEIGFFPTETAKMRNLTPGDPAIETLSVHFILSV